MQFKLPEVYPITDKQLARKTSQLCIIKELVRGGARIVQIRDKYTSLRELMPDLYRCMEFASNKGVVLIINDRCDLALSCNASGVHLGQEDIPPEQARLIMGREKILGFSNHTLAQVRQSARLPIQYIGFGPVYATSTKATPYPTVGLHKLALACRESALPVVAIGGIGLEQVRDVLQAGAASAAVISALMKAKSLAREMEKFLEKAREK